MASPWAQAKAGQKISAPKQSKYQGYQGQAGGSSSIPSQGKRDAFVQLQRQKFFDNRPDVSEDRILRRTRQEGGIDQFKQALIDRGFEKWTTKGRVLTGTRPDGSSYTVMNPNTGEPVFLTDRPGGRSVSDVAQDLAFRFGPTPREVFGDIGYGLGSIAKGFAEKGTPMIQLLKGLYQKGKDYFTRPSGIETAVVPQAQGGIFEGQPIRTGIETLTPQFPYNFETIMKPRPDPLQPSEMSEEQFMQSFPELYSSLFQQRNYEPIRVNDMNITGVTAENKGQFEDRPVLPPNVIPMMRVGEPMNINQYRTPVLPPDITDPRLYQNQVLFAKEGGSVDKYAGLGYKLK